MGKNSPILKQIKKINTSVLLYIFIETKKNCQFNIEEDEKFILT